MNDPNSVKGSNSQILQRARKEIKILDALKNGATTYRELSLEVGIPVRTLRYLIAGLVEAGVVKRIPNSHKIGLMPQAA